MRKGLITGADRGLGFALTKLLLSEGWNVYAGQYMPDWPGLAGLKEQYGDQLFILPLDVSTDESVDEAAKIVNKHEQSLDAVINVAGILCSYSGDIFQRPDGDAMTRTYQVNSIGPLRVANRFMPMLLKGDERLLVNISSEAGSVSGNWRNDNYGYCMSKAALNMACAILQHHLGGQGVKVFAIDPGWMRSYMNGSFNEKGTVDTDDSARGIYKLMQEKRDIEGPMYYKYTGEEMFF